MGKIKQGILGGFNGTTGSVVGASWKGIAYMRGKAQSIKNPRTESQQGNRTKFGYFADVMSKAKMAVDLGFAGDTSKKSAFNSAVQANMKRITGVLDLSVIKDVLFSKGNMQPLAGGSVTKNASVVTATFNSYSMVSEALPICVVFAVVGDFAGSPFISTSLSNIASEASSGTETYTIPESLDVSEVHAFAFSYDEVAKNASDTCWLGKVTIE